MTPNRKTNKQMSKQGALIRIGTESINATLVLKRKSVSSCPKCGCKGSSSLEQLWHSGVMASGWKRRTRDGGRSTRWEGSDLSTSASLSPTFLTCEVVRLNTQLYSSSEILWISNGRHSAFSKSILGMKQSFVHDWGPPGNPDDVRVGPLPPLWLCCGLIISVKTSRVPILVFSQGPPCRSQSQQCPWRRGSSLAGVIEALFSNSWTIYWLNWL